MTQLLELANQSRQEWNETAYLVGQDAELLKTSEGRRILTRLDPLLFAVTYCPHHLVSETGGPITMSRFHLDLIEQAKTWVRTNDQPGGHRDAYIAPRDSGKSTWLFTLLPLWAAAHGHVRFVAAFSDSATQAEVHLQTFKHELDHNDLLRADYPLLCQPEKRALGGTTVADNRTLMLTRSGFVFSARGIDSAVLGLKVGTLRPDLLILDDVEKDESSYSTGGARKRLITITDSILPLNVYARVLMAGTVTMPGSIIHQLVKAARTTEVEPWITDTGFRAHYYPPITTDDQGTEASLWEAKWPLAYLRSIRHTRDFAKNYLNDPLGADGEFWVMQDFTHLDTGPPTHQILSVDPAVTATAASDYTGLAILSWSPTCHQHSVDEAVHVKLTPARLRLKVVELLTAHPAVRKILVESNQGGILWRQIFTGLPVQIELVAQSRAKVARAQEVLNHYQQGHVVHRKALPEAEQEMVVFPRGINDDLVDAICSGIIYNHARLTKARQPTKPLAQAASYL